MLSVKNNILAWNANRQLIINRKSNAKLAEKLSSGYRINRSADDAAGLSISEKMRRQIRGLTQASSNAQDGISMVQSAEGALNEIHDMLQRINELTIKTSTGTLTDADRAMADEEVQLIKEEIDKIADHTVFNEIRLFPEDGSSPMTSSLNKNFSYELSFDLKNNSYSLSSMNNMARAGIDASGKGELADKIANEMIPNAVSQIFNAFPAFAQAQGSTVIDMSLNISYIDGPGNTLALAGFTYKYSGGPPVSMYIKVDAADFTNADADASSEKAKVLESTIAHELMHTVMQYNLTDGMSGRNGEKYPTWFVEGTAQLSGGGFPTNWNNELLYYADKLTSENDTSQDANISNYLKKYTIDSRPYGHGYLASAYIGYLANGGTGDVSGQNIAAGMNKVFDSLLKGKSLDSAIIEHTGMSEAQIKNLFRSGDAGLTEFTRKLAYNSKDGAGSVIANSLSDGGAGSPVIGSGASGGNFQINQIDVDFSSGPAKVRIQAGAEAEQYIEFKLFQMNAAALGLSYINVKTVEDSYSTIDSVKNAISYVSRVRGYYGSIQNRLEHTINNLDNIIENTTAAESCIRDTDMAKEMVSFSNRQIILQAGQSMLAQANHQSDYVLRLLE